MHSKDCHILINRVDRAGVICNVNEIGIILKRASCLLQKARPRAFLHFLIPPCEYTGRVSFAAAGLDKVINEILYRMETLAV